MKRAVLVVALLCAVGPSASAQQGAPQPVDEHLAAARELLGAMGVSARGSKVMDEMFQHFKGALPMVPPAVWDEMRKTFEGDEFVQLQADMYKKHFTLDEIRGLTAFYSSPLGRRFIEVQPELLKEGMALGQQFAQRTFERLRRELAAKGYKV